MFTLSLSIGDDKSGGDESVWLSSLRIAETGVREILGCRQFPRAVLPLRVEGREDHRLLAVVVVVPQI